MPSLVTLQTIRQDWLHCAIFTILCKLKSHPLRRICWRSHNYRMWMVKVFIAATSSSSNIPRLHGIPWLSTILVIRRLLSLSGLVRSVSRLCTVASVWRVMSAGHSRCFVRTPPTTMTPTGYLWLCIRRPIAVRTRRMMMHHSTRRFRSGMNGDVSSCRSVEVCFQICSWQ